MYAYRSIVRNRIAPHLGTVPLAKLGPLDVQGCYRALGVAGYAPKTIHLTHTVLRQALSQAVRWRLVPTNAAADADLPAGRRKEIEAWTAGDARAFLAATAGDDRHALWRLLLDSGMRLGEALALAWADVDLAADTVAIRRTLTRTKGGGWIVGDAAKTRAGRRPIAISPPTVVALRAHRAAQAERRLRLGQDWVNEGFVFDRGDGGRSSPATVQHAFERAVTNAGVPRLTPHGCRHTSATLLILAGVPLKVVSERLGHASVAITADVYGHVTAEADRSAADRLAELLA
jgi:integrase